MKFAAFLLIAVSLVLGVVGAVTAYLPPLRLPDDQLIGLHLNAPAGVKDPAAAKPEPIATKGAEITPELLAELRQAEVQRIRVKEFSLSRWPEWWLFLIGAVGLFVGAMVVRRENRRAIAAAGQSRSAAGEGPDDSFSAIESAVQRLRQQIPALETTDDRLRAILDGLGEAQRTHIPAFIAARPVLIGRLGLGGYARLMDAFAAAERQINRSWSAAADDVEPEALVCLDRAAELLEHAKPRLSTAQPA